MWSSDYELGGYHWMMFIIPSISTITLLMAQQFWKKNIIRYNIFGHAKADDKKLREVVGYLAPSSTTHLVCIVNFYYVCWILIKQPSTTVLTGNYNAMTLEEKQMWSSMILAGNINGMVFIGYVIGDFISVYDQLLEDPVMAIHHVVEITIGLLLINCGWGLCEGYASFLLAQELSSPALALFQVTKKQYGWEKVTSVAGNMFAVLFFLTRICFMSYGTFHYLISYIYKQEMFPSSMSQWKRITLMLCLVCQQLLQYFWFIQIIRKVIFYKKQEKGSTKSE